MNKHLLPIFQILAVFLPFFFYHWTRVSFSLSIGIKFEARSHENAGERESLPSECLASTKMQSCLSNKVTSEQQLICPWS